MPAVGIVPSGAASTAVGVTWQRYWSLLADQLGLYANDLTVLSQASFEPRRNVIVDKLRDDDAGREQWAGGYLYGRTSATGGTQAKILGQGYHGQFGALALADPPATAFPDGTALELSYPLPIKRHNAIKGVADLVNEALTRVWLEARIVINGDGTQDYSLTAYPWLRSKAQTRGIWDYRSYGTSYPTALSVAGYEVRTNGATRTLVTAATYSTSETFELAVLVRGDRLIYDGSTWSYPATPGLTADTSQAAAPEEWVVTIGMVKGLQQLRKMPGIDQADVERRMKIWAPAAAEIILHEQPEPLADPVEPMVVGETTVSDAMSREVIGTP